MDEAIEKTKKRATTVIKSSDERELEIPTVTICPKPGFKPSISEKYNLSNPARYLFLYEDNRDIFSTQKTIKGVQNKKFGTYCIIKSPNIVSDLKEKMQQGRVALSDEISLLRKEALCVLANQKAAKGPQSLPSLRIKFGPKAWHIRKENW